MLVFHLDERAQPLRSLCVSPCVCVCEIRWACSWLGRRGAEPHSGLCWPRVHKLVSLSLQWNFLFFWILLVLKFVSSDHVFFGPLLAFQYVLANLASFGPSDSRHRSSVVSSVLWRRGGPVPVSSRTEPRG